MRALRITLALATLPLLLAAFGATAQAADIYYGSAGQIGRANLDGTNQDSSFITGTAAVDWVVIDETYVYWTRYESAANGGGIYRARRDRSTPVEPVLTGLNHPAALAIHDGYLYYSDSDAIGRLRVDGSEHDPAFVDGSPISPGSIAVNDTHIFWTKWSPSSGGISRADIDGTNVVANFIATGPAQPGASFVMPDGIAVDDTHVYWANWDGGVGTSIGRANLDGTGKVRNFVSGAPDTVRGVALDGSHVYWGVIGEFGDGTNYGRAKLDGTGVDHAFITVPQSTEGVPSGIAVDASRTSATTLSCDPGTPPATTPTTCTATVTDTDAGTPASPTGTVALSSTGGGVFGPPASCGLEPSGSGVASCSVSYTATAPGGETLTAAYAGNAGHRASSGQATIAVGPPPHPTTTSVACDPNPLPATSTTTCVVTVSDGFGTPSVPTGTVALSSNGDGEFEPAASCTLAPASASSARCEVDYVPGAPGDQTVTAAYPGAAPHAASSGQTTLGVGPAPHPTTTTLACLPAAVVAGEATTCTVTVSDDFASPSVPTGTVALSSNGSGAFDPAASCTLAPAGAASASCEVDYTPAAAGQHALTASYAGAQPHVASSGQVTLAVDPAPHATSAAVACDPDPVPATLTATCTVTVTDSSASPTAPAGSVDLSSSGAGEFEPDAGCTLAASGPDGAGCSVSYVPSVAGDHTVTAVYAGDATHEPASADTQLTVGAPPPHPTATTLACQPPSPTVGTSTTCTATVTDTHATLAESPAGAVAFASDAAGAFAPAAGCTLEAVDADSSACSVDYTPARQGAHAISATYAGNAGHEAGDPGETTLSVAAASVAPPPPPPPPPPVVSNAFSFGKLTRSPKKGTATLRVELPGKGSLVLAGAGVKRASAGATGAGIVTLPIKAKGKALRTLRRKRKATLRITVTFTPEGGSALDRSKRVTLKLSKRKRGARR